MFRDYSFNMRSSTLSGSVVWVGLLSSIFLTGAASANAPVQTKNSYEIHDPAVTPSAANQFYFVDTLTSSSQSFDFERSVAKFYASLKSDQEPLGETFEKVLVDNLWDLYSQS